MDENRFDQTLKMVTGTAGRRAALHSPGAAGMGLFAVLGLAGAAAKDKTTNGGGDGRTNGRGNQHRRTGKDTNSVFQNLVCWYGRRSPVPRGATVASSRWVSRFSRNR